MTEADWLACEDPPLMLEFLRSRASVRKLRLFASACCRYFFCDPHGGHVELEMSILEPIEWFADGLIGENDRRRAEQEAEDLDDYSFYALHKREALRALTADPFILQALYYQLEQFTESQGCYEGELTAVGSSYLRDVFRHPLRPVHLAARWQVWNQGNAVKLAQGIYDDRAFERLPMLADALQDAGCDNADILDHCRLPGEHVRGCWVIDLLLCKD